MLRVCSISDLAPIHYNLSGRRILVPISGYLDSSNDRGTHDVITLACFSAMADDWPPFENAWMEAVDKAWNGCVVPEDTTPHLHAANLISGQPPFTKANGWTLDKATTLLADCSNVIQAHWNAGKIMGVSATVMIGDYKRVCVDVPDTPAYQDICAFFCMSRVFAWSPEIAAEFLSHGGSIYFDRNDPFRGAPTNLFRNKKFMKKNRDSWGKLTDVGCVIMEMTPAIQAADLLAWSISAGWKKWEHGLWQRQLLQLRRPFLWLNEHILRHPADGALAEWKELGLPKRRR